MSYVIYALFQVPGAAAKAMNEVAALELPKDGYKIDVHKDRFMEEGSTSEGDGSKGITVGLCVGGFVGALLGGILCGPIGFLRLPLAVAMGFGLFFGLALGGFASGIYGMGLLHRNFERLLRAIRPGGVLLTVEMETLEIQDAIERIFRKYGAIEASRS